MANLAGKLAKLILGIQPDEATAARRGFAISDPAMRCRLEMVGATFICGYHSALEVRTLDELRCRLDSVELEWRGFAYEGAAMALALLDYFTLGRRNRLARFLRGPGDAHKYMVHVGAGWALAHMPVRIGAPLGGLDPVLRWLAIDGLGFHEGYFHWDRYVDGNAGKRPPSGYEARVFDQGLGRSLWFVEGGDVDRIQGRFSGFHELRHGDLWSGIGLACAYAGALSRPQLERLRSAAGCHLPSVAQGAAFAAKARQRAGNPAVHTEAACRVLCGTSADDAAAITDVALRDIDGRPGAPPYELWRKRIATIIAEQERAGICPT